MSSLFLRGAALSAVAVATAAAPAQSAPQLLGSGSYNDATSDGRYVLVSGGVLDRTTGTTLPRGTGYPVALADRAPRVLVNVDDKLVVRDLVAGTEQAASIDVDGASIGLPESGGRAELTEDGQTVVFTAAGATPRVIERNLATGMSTVRVAGASLLDASEDGKVVTFIRELVPATRPDGSASVPEEPASVGGNAVGYQLRGQAARIVETSSATVGLIAGSDTGACSERRARITAWKRPYDLQISQNAASQYALYLSRAVASGSEIVTAGHTVIDRLTTDGASLLVESAFPSVQDRVTADPVSGAYTLINSTHGGGNIVNSARLVAQDGTSRTLTFVPVEGPGGSGGSGLGFTTNALPVNAGAGAVYTGAPRTGDPRQSRVGVYADDAAAPGASVGTPWLTLPRAADAADTAGLRPSVTWPDCGPASAPATIADYAALTLKTTGNSAGSIAVTIAPGGKAKAKSVTATVSWLGFPIYTRRVVTDATIKLPAIPVGIGGFKLTLEAKLADGKTLRSSTALRRTR